MLSIELVNALEQLNVTITVSPSLCEAMGARGYWCEEDWEIVLSDIDEEALFHEATHTLQSILGGLVGFNPTKSAIERVAACSYKGHKIPLEVEAFSVMETKEYQEELVARLMSSEVKALYLSKMAKKERLLNGSLAMLAVGCLFAFLANLHLILAVPAFSSIWGCLLQYKKAVK